MNDTTNEMEPEVPDLALPGETDEVDTGRDYVTFEMQGDRFALEMERVQEIIRMPQLVRVPLGPPCLEGLANLRGRVLPVISLRTTCGLETAEHDEATRVVVVESAGTTLGVVVDRVAAVVSVEPEEVQGADTVQATVRSELLAGVIKRAQDPVTMVLDVQHLITNEFARVAAAARARPTGPPGSTADRAGAEEGEDLSDTLELVSFTVDGQEYALPIDRVQEIVQAPEAVTSVPNAASRVLGVMDLRGGLLPVVSLRGVFGLPQHELEPHNRIVVITVDRDGERSLVGIVMDTVREVLRVPLQLVGALPHAVAGSGRTEVVSVCRLESGARLVSVLSADALVDATVDLGEEEPLTTHHTDGASMGHDDGRGDDDLLVVFRLEGEEYCVDVDAVQEIIRVPDTLVRVPQTVPYVEGLVNLRGAVLPVVDLRTRLGLTRTERDERQRIVVLTIGGNRTGFVVDSVAEVARVGHQDLEPAPELSEEQAKVVSRIANLPGQQRMLLVLEARELLAGDELAAMAEEGPAASTVAA